MQLDLLLDLETIPDPSLPPTPPHPKQPQRIELSDGLLTGTLAPYYRDFPVPVHHQIACAGYAWLEDYKPVSWGVLSSQPPSSENLLLTQLTEALQRFQPRLVGFNSRHFDCPVLAARCYANGIPFPWYYDSSRRTDSARYRFSDSRHLDLLDFLADNGAADMTSLDAWARACGMPGKGDVHGGDVGGLWAAGEYEKVASYNMHDVVQETAVHQRTALLRGALGTDAYQEATKLLVELMAADVRTTELCPKIDYDRLFLTGTFLSEGV